MWRGSDLECGSNLQNISKASRIIYIADEGKTLVQVDQAGAEALIVAYLCAPGRFRDLFSYGIKPHTFVALHVFADVWYSRGAVSGDYSREDVSGSLSARIQQLRDVGGWPGLESDIEASDGWPPSERYYFIAKMICHASNYGMKAPTFTLNVLQKSDGQIRLTLKQAEKFLDTYHGLFPEIREWHSATIDMLGRGRLLRNLFGYPATFQGQWNESLHKQAFAFVPQSTVGCITHLAAIEIQQRLDDRDPLLEGVDLLQNGHDSLLLQCPLGAEATVIPIIKSHLERDLVSPRGEHFKMRAEASTGQNWKEMKKYKL